MSHSIPGTTVTPGRRSFLAWASALAGAIAGLLFTLPVVGYLAGALRKRRPDWIAIGPISGFPLHETRLVAFVNKPLEQPWDGMVANATVYVRNLGKDADKKDQLLVFAANCTHLGCPVTWFPQSGLFMCPCHGGVYYENGEHASGPPPRGLYHCPWRIKDGKLEVMAPHLPTLQDTLDQGSGVRSQGQKV